MNGSDELAILQGDGTALMSHTEVVEGEVVEDVAAMGLGYPIEGKVIRSSSSTLHFLKPTLTLRYDMETRERDVIADANQQGSFVRIVLTIAGRRYRFWVPNPHDGTSGEIVDRATEVLIYAQPSEVRQVQEIR